LATFGVTITDVEADNYYKKNPDLFTTPKQYKLAVIVVSSADAQKKVDAELAAGKKFNDVASELSEDATKNVNGEYGTLPVTVLGEKTKAALESTKIGQCTTWLESAQNSSQTAFVKFYIEDVLPPVLQELTPDLRRSIRNKRMLEIGSIKNDIDAEMKDMRKEAKIDITIKPFADAYAKFIQAFLKDHAN
jgi:foldase protein PrsA